MRQLKVTDQITDRESESLERYLSDIRKVDLLTPEEEVELGRKIKRNDLDALERLVSANLRFVVSVAKQYQHQGLSLSDLINEGNIGLIKACQRFDETKGFKLISYAVWWIRQSILAALAEDSRIVRLPLNQVGTIGKINKMHKHLEQEFEREPSVEEIADGLELKANDVEHLLQSYQRHASTDALLPGVEEDGPTLLDVIVGENNKERTDKTSFNKDAERFFSILTPAQRIVIIYHLGLFGKEVYSFETIGDNMPYLLPGQQELTSERVRQIFEKAKQKMREHKSKKILRKYL